MAYDMQTTNALSSTVQNVKDSAGNGSALNLGTTKVGIGTSTTESALHVKGPVSLINDSSISALISGSGAGKIYTTRYTGGSYPFTFDGHLVFQARTYSGNGHNIIFATHSPGVGVRLAMMISDSGKVGIGDTNYTNAMLQIKPPSSISDDCPNIRLRGTTSSTPTGGQDGDVQIYENGTTRRFYIKINSNWKYATLTAA